MSRHAELLEKALQLALNSPDRPFGEALREAAGRLGMPGPVPEPTSAVTMSEETGAIRGTTGVVVRFADGGEAVATIVSTYL